MRAILLAAGYGVRLRPLTNTVPKCLVLIRGKPLLEIWLEQLTLAGFGPFLINTHYLSECVEEFIANSPYRDRVTLVYEPELLGTAGTLIRNLDFFQGQDGLLMHADNYCLADLKAFLEAHQHRPTECLMTMMTFRTESPESCGIVQTDDRDIVQHFYEKVKLPPGNLANGAVYLLSAEMLKMNLGNLTDFSSEVLPCFMGKIKVFETQKEFFDIGTNANYVKANLI